MVIHLEISASEIHEEEVLAWLLARLEASEELFARYAVGVFVAGGGIGVVPGWFWCGDGGHVSAAILVYDQMGDDGKLQSCEIALVARRREGSCPSCDQDVVRFLALSWDCCDWPIFI